MTIKGFCQECSAKLEREGKVVYGYKTNLPWHNVELADGKYKALLINIEEISPCLHPKDKVKEKKIETYGGMVLGPKEKLWTHLTYECECGKNVKPSAYEELK